MLTQIKLTNFKCFKEETTFPLSKFNLFTGVNGAGKSTLLQSLLLMRQSIDHNPYTSELILNGSCVNLGSFDDVRNKAISASESIFFEFHIDKKLTFNDISAITSLEQLPSELNLQVYASANYQLTNNSDIGLLIHNMKITHNFMEFLA